MLVTNGIFIEVYVNLMLIGYKHYNIDTLFGRWSMSLGKKNFPILLLLIISFVDIESFPTDFHLIETPDFKSFIARYIVEEDEALKGQ